MNCVQKARRSTNGPRGYSNIACFCCRLEAFRETGFQLEWTHRRFRLQCTSLLHLLFAKTFRCAARQIRRDVKSFYSRALCRFKHFCMNRPSPQSSSFQWKESRHLLSPSTKVEKAFLLITSMLPMNPSSQVAK